MNKATDNLNDLQDHANELVHLLNDCRGSKHCPPPPPCPPPSCPTPAPTPTPPSPPPAPTPTPTPTPPPPAPPAPQAFCDPRGARPQLCPGQIPCPQCGESICPCP